MFVFLCRCRRFVIGNINKTKQMALDDEIEIYGLNKIIEKY